MQTNPPFVPSTQFTQSTYFLSLQITNHYPIWYVSISKISDQDDAISPYIQIILF